MDEQNEIWLDVESYPGALTNIMNNYSKSPTRFRVVTEGGSTIEFTLDFGFTAMVRNRGDITSVQLRGDKADIKGETGEDQADDQ